MVYLCAYHFLARRNGIFASDQVDAERANSKENEEKERWRDGGGEVRKKIYKNIKKNKTP